MTEVSKDALLPTPDIAAFAAGLTKTQRDCLCLEMVRDGDDLKLMWEYQANASTRCALQRRGLWRNRMYSTVFTPAGLSVRQFLLKGTQ